MCRHFSIIVSLSWLISINTREIKERKMTMTNQKLISSKIFDALILWIKIEMNTFLRTTEEKKNIVQHLDKFNETNQTNQKQSLHIHTQTMIIVYLMA